MRLQTLTLKVDFIEQNERLGQEILGRIPLLQ